MLFNRLEQAPEAGQCTVGIPRRSEQNFPPRQTILSIRYCSATVYKARFRTKIPQESISLHTILAREIDSPEGEDPIEWFLLTTIPIGSLEEAVQKIEWYRERWKIERFHYILKSGCGIEDLQLATKERLENAIALYSVVAWRLSWLTYQARETPDISCSIILEKHEWQALYCVVNKTHTPPEDPPTLSETVCAVSRNSMRAFYLLIIFDQFRLLSEIWVMNSPQGEKRTVFLCRFLAWCWMFFYCFLDKDLHFSRCRGESSAPWSRPMRARTCSYSLHQAYLLAGKVELIKLHGYKDKSAWFRLKPPIYSLQSIPESSFDLE